MKNVIKIFGISHVFFRGCASNFWNSPMLLQPTIVSFDIMLNCEAYSAHTRQGDQLTLLHLLCLYLFVLGCHSLVFVCLACHLYLFPAFALLQQRYLLAPLFNMGIYLLAPVVMVGEVCQYYLDLIIRSYMFYIDIAKMHLNWFKGVLHPRLVFGLFLHFSQKLQHIGNK